mgnify:FL=1|tara:strand:- start:13582 stop:13881 length:300 start_codon:yes stop_codon:yes gene_type:complete
MPPRYIKPMTPLTYKVLRKAAISISYYKNFFPYIKSTVEFKKMQKNSGEIFTSIEVDTVTGQYYTVIPEAVVNEMGWFEDTSLRWTMDGKEVIITEQDN